MILFEILQTEQHDVYQELEIANGNRQYDFLRSVVNTSLAIHRPFLSSQIIKALNFHAIVCLHTNPGEYRPCGVTVGSYVPPADFRVQALMDDFVNTVNRSWEATDPVALAAFVLWRLNHIHPFINGNGRTARATCYYVLCVKVGSWLPGTKLLPELIREHRNEYVQALKDADEAFLQGNIDLSNLHSLLVHLLEMQLETAAAPFTT